VYISQSAGGMGKVVAEYPAPGETVMLHIMGNFNNSSY